MAILRGVSCLRCRLPCDRLILTRRLASERLTAAICPGRGQHHPIATVRFVRRLVDKRNYPLSLSVAVLLFW